MALWDEVVETLRDEIVRSGGIIKAARKLGVSRATLWTWQNETRGRNYISLFNALDIIGVHLTAVPPTPKELPQEPQKKQESTVSVSSDTDYELVLKSSQKREAELREKIANLEGQNEILQKILSDIVGQLKKK